MHIPMESFWEVFVFTPKKSVGMVKVRPNCSFVWTKRTTITFWEVFVFTLKKSVGMVEVRRNCSLVWTKRMTITYFCNYSMFTPIIFSQMETRCSFFHSVGAQMLAKTKIAAELLSRQKFWLGKTNGPSSN